VHCRKCVSIQRASRRYILECPFLRTLSVGYRGPGIHKPLSKVEAMLWTQSDDEQVAALDPLASDILMSKVPEWNEVANIGEMVCALQVMCKKALLETRSYYELLAIVRDLGILAGSLRRHGQEPIVLVPELEAIFLRAGSLTDLIPRDTLMHYTVWNPSEGRLRLYTKNAQEPDLIASIKQSFPAIREATRHLFELRDYPLHQQRTLRLTYQIAHSLRDFILGLHHAMRHVEPAIFIKEFRPFFEPFRVGFEQFRGPGAVTMPLHVFDFLLWGTSEQDPRYIQFTADYVPYNTGEFRQYFLRARNTPSLLDRLEADLNRTKPTLGSQALLSPVIVCMKRVRAFRNAHLKYAIMAYHGATQHDFKSGSGGHTTADLDWLSNLTTKHALRLETLKLRFAIPSVNSSTITAKRSNAASGGI
jgi:monodechloroaminopyrrolnitrin synthase